MTLTRSERIHKATARLATHPKAVDILFVSLSKARDNATTEKFRKVNLENSVFKSTVGAAPSGIELLYACGYEPMHGHLVLQRHDEALLNTALDSLTRAKQSTAYLEASAAASRAAEEAARTQAAEQLVAQKRAKHLSRVPKEPFDVGATSCVVINVKLNEERIASRRFDSEATLRDLLHYVRSLERVPDPDATLRVENVTTAPAALLNTEDNLDRSLYSLDLWPVSHVRVEVCAAA